MFTNIYKVTSPTVIEKFVDNVELVVLSEVNGNFVVSLKGSRIAIGKELAKKIIVG